MGVDAQMFARIRGEGNWVKPRDLPRLSHALGSVVGSEALMMTRATDEDWKTKLPVGRAGVSLSLKIISEYHQDGPSIERAPGEQFVEVKLWSRMYHEQYARGSWPLLRGIAEWMEACLAPHAGPMVEVWYGGDSSGMCAEHLHEARRSALTRFWLASGRSSYWMNTPEPGGLTCVTCEAGMICNGGGGPDALKFWFCSGCGVRVTERHGRVLLNVGEGHEISHDVTDLGWRGEAWHEAPITSS